MIQYYCIGDLSIILLWAVVQGVPVERIVHVTDTYQTDGLVSKHIILVFPRDKLNPATRAYFKSRFLLISVSEGDFT